MYDELLRLKLKLQTRLLKNALRKNQPFSGGAKESGYSSHGKWAPLSEIHHLETKERGNSWHVPSHVDHSKHEAIWVTHNKAGANKYGSKDETKHVDLKGAKPVMSDGDGGHLYVRPNSLRKDEDIVAGSEGVAGGKGAPPMKELVDKKKRLKQEEIEAMSREIVDKAEVLKGAMQRLATFSPQKDVPKRAAQSIGHWQDANTHGTREKIPPMTGSLRTRALHSLHAATQVRRATDGGREFLLHRGTNGQEHGYADKDTHVNHEQHRSSWTPHHSIAQSFANSAPERKGGGKVMSAWIHEKNIVHSPKHVGATTVSGVAGAERIHRGEKGPLKPKGSNEYKDEHEIIVERGHKSAKASSKDLEHSFNRKDIHSRINTRQAFRTYSESFKSIKEKSDVLKALLTKKKLDPAEGVTITHEDHFKPKHILVRAHKDGKQIGRVVADVSGHKYVTSKDTDVHPDHRRKGVASAMYAHIEHHTGKKMVPSTDRTSDGKKLWGGTRHDPNKQFGKAAILKSLAVLDESMRNLAKGKAGEPIDLVKQLKIIESFIKNDPIQAVYDVMGIQVNIEWPKGSVREYKDGFKRDMHNSYGYIHGVMGDDGEQLDCYLGDHLDSKRIFVIDQHKKDTGKYDEEKVMIGFQSPEQAKMCYEANMLPENFGNIREITIDELKRRITRKPQGLPQGEKLADGAQHIVKSVGDIPKRFSLISGEQPRARVHDTRPLEHHLKSKGYTYHKVKGTYGGQKETSYMVENASHKHIEHLGRKYGQESVIHHDSGHQKLVYTTGKNAGQHHKGSGVNHHKTAPKDNFTTHQGKHFTLNFDFGKLHK